MLVLYRTVSAFPFKCLAESPKICIVDNQKEGYFLKIKKDSDRKFCLYCCIKKSFRNYNLIVAQDERYVTLSF
jgi:hypothetical protein